MARPFPRGVRPAKSPQREPQIADPCQSERGGVEAGVHKLREAGSLFPELSESALPHSSPLACQPGRAVLGVLPTLG